MTRPRRNSPRSLWESGWSRVYNKWLAKGADHGDAAYRADQAEERLNRSTMAGKTAKRWAAEYLQANGWEPGDDLGDIEPAFAWLIAKATAPARGD